MTQREKDEKRKLTRRVFLQHTAVVSSTVGAYAITLRTDAMAQIAAPMRMLTDGSHTYPYQ
jgi:hypothetical protein